MFSLIQLQKGKLGFLKIKINLIEFVQNILYLDLSEYLKDNTFLKPWHQKLIFFDFPGYVRPPV